MSKGVELPVMSNSAPLLIHGADKYLCKKNDLTLANLIRRSKLNYPPSTSHYSSPKLSAMLM